MRILSFLLLKFEDRQAQPIEVVIYYEIYVQPLL
jgi:hypothetical protein